MNEYGRRRPIVLLSSFAPPTLGGVATVLSSLLLEYIRRDLPVAVVAPTPRPADSRFSKVTWVASPSLMQARRAMLAYMTGHTGNWEQTFAEAERAGADIAQVIRPLDPILLHSHTESWIAGIAASRLRIPHVATLHGCPPFPEDFAQEELAYNERTETMRNLVREANAAALIEVSHYARDKWLKSGIAAGVISVIYNPIRFDLFQRASAETRERTRCELGILPGERLLCFAQRPARFGVHTMLRGFGLLWESRKDVRFLFCACQEPTTIVGHLATNPALRSAVLARAFDIEDMPRVYAASDIVIAPGTRECFDLPAMEALSCGVPVVACASGAHCELLHERRTALLYRPGDPEHLAECVQELLDDPALRKSLAQAPHEQLRRYRPDAIADQYLQLYAKVAGEPSRFVG